MVYHHRRGRVGYIGTAQWNDAGVLSIIHHISYIVLLLLLL